MKTTAKGGQAKPEQGNATSFNWWLFTSYFGKTRSNDDINDVKRSEATMQILDVSRYIKNYEGSLTRVGKTINKYRFSDEREWRYVPDYSSSCKSMYEDNGFAKDEAEKSLAGMRLEFVPNDVKYIIIKNDQEISEFIEHLRSAKEKTYSQDDVERLTTRLLTSEQIHNDV